MPVVIYIDE